MPLALLTDYLSWPNGYPGYRGSDEGEFPATRGDELPFNRLVMSKFSVFLGSRSKVKAPGRTSITCNLNQGLCVAKLTTSTHG